MTRHNLPANVTQSGTQWQLLNEATVALRHATTAETVVSVIADSLNKMGFQVLGGAVNLQTAELPISIVSHTGHTLFFGYVSPSQSLKLKNTVVSLKNLSFFEQVIEDGSVVYSILGADDLNTLLNPLLSVLASPPTACPCIAIPLREKEATTYLLLASAADIDPSIVPSIMAFANLGSTIIENLRLLQQEKGQRQISQTLQTVSNIVNSSLELDTVLNLILEQLETVVPYDSAAIMLERKNNLKMEAGHGFRSDTSILQVEIPIDTNVLYNEMKQTHRPIIIDDVHKDPRYMLWEGTSPIHSWIGTPIMWEGKTIGQISIDSFSIHAFSAEQGDLAFVFAQLVAAAINNARLFRQAHRTAEELRALLNSARDVASTLETDKVMTAVAARVNDLMSTQFTAIYLLSRDKASLVPVISLDESHNIHIAERAHTAAAEVVDRKQGLIFNQLTLVGSDRKSVV